MHDISVNSDPQNISTDSIENELRTYPGIPSTDPRWVSTFGQTISFPGGGRIVVWEDEVSLTPFPL